MIWFLLGLILAAVSVLLVIDHEQGGLDSVLAFLDSMPGGTGAPVGAFFGAVIGIGLWRETTQSAAAANRLETHAESAATPEPKTEEKPDVKADPIPEPKLVCRAAEIEKANDKWRRQERDDRLRARHEDEEERARERRTLAAALIHEVTAMTRALEDRKRIYQEHDKRSDNNNAPVPKLLLPEARVFAANTHIIAGMDAETAGSLAELNVALQDAVQIVEFRANDEIVQIKAAEVVSLLDGLLSQAREVKGLLDLSVKEASVPLNLNSVA